MNLRDHQIWKQTERFRIASWFRWPVTGECMAISKIRFAVFLVKKEDNFLGKSCDSINEIYLLFAKKRSLETQLQFNCNLCSLDSQ